MLCCAVLGYHIMCYAAICCAMLCYALVCAVLCCAMLCCAGPDGGPGHRNLPHVIGDDTSVFAFFVFLMLIKIKFNPKIA